MNEKILLLQKGEKYSIGDVIYTKFGKGKVIRIEYDVKHKSIAILVDHEVHKTGLHYGLSPIDYKYHCPSKNGYWFLECSLWADEEKNAISQEQEKQKEEKKTDPRIQRIIKAKNELKDGGFTRDETFELIKMLMHKGEI